METLYIVIGALSSILIFLLGYSVNGVLTVKKRVDELEKFIEVTDDRVTEVDRERNFWKEGLVCANAQNRKIDNSTFETPEYDLRLHKCCRELGKDFTFFRKPI